MDRIELVWRCKPTENTEKAVPKGFSPQEVAQVQAFHRSFEGYRETPLVQLKTAALEIGLKGLYVKDESQRFGLNAFKSLGASYAMGKCIAQRLGVDISQLSYQQLVSPEIHEQLGDVTFVTATDGNHGRGVAWTANKLGQKSVVYLPKGSSQERLENIRAQGADAFITELSYDDAVRLARDKAAANGWILVQDTAWEGYEDIPLWIMQGYTTMVQEALGQMKKQQLPTITHVFLQAGVGSMAAAVTAFLAQQYGEDMPIITVVEPNKADCIFKTAQANDGELHFITHSMDTIMAGLACGEPCTIGWNILKDYADNFISCPDFVAKNGMRFLAFPKGEDKKIISGESGGVTTGLVVQLMQDPSLSHIKKRLCLDDNSVVLCFNTEGDTEQTSYRKIVLDEIQITD
ncbi:MAG: diaminopropionate ammonia-lyase [Oscillospiraceae bacterium]